MIAEVMKMREEEKNRSSQESKIKRFFKKRWVFPAIYIATAAIILTGVLWYQGSNNSDTSKFDYKATDIGGKKIQDMPSIEVNRAMENFVMPVSNPDTAVVKKPFYEFDGKKEQQEAALVFYNNTYHPNTGIDIAAKDGKTFEVVAALSGTVTDVKEDSLLGNVIVIEHDKGIVTQYQSVKDIAVAVGDEVEQGQPIAKAGQSLYNEKAGVHVHFEIRKDNIPVNPNDYINKPLSALQDADVKPQKSTENAADKSEMTDDGNATDENKSVDDKKATDENKSADDKKATDENKSADKKNAYDSKSTEDKNADSKKDSSDKSDGNSKKDTNNGGELQEKPSSMNS
jgi:stage II sporulation protein Q